MPGCSALERTEPVPLRSRLMAQSKLPTDEAKVLLMEPDTSEGNALPPRYLRIGSAVFYAVASFLITVVNKSVLTVYGFPSFLVLGLGQMVSTMVVLWTARVIGYVDFPALEKDTFKRVWPLPLIYAGNMMFGLGGTKELSLPMMTVLRRFSILMTMIAEERLLSVRPSRPVRLSVYAMIGGALVAASGDLAFNVAGYAFILLNDAFTAANGVYLKKKLDARQLGNNGLLFYNSLFSMPLAVVITALTGDLGKAWRFEGWWDTWFLVQFGVSCVMGFVLSYSILLCTKYNSALTTTIVGCLKNIAVTYGGMFIGSDYVFHMVNFVGLNISVLGSLAYTWLTFRERGEKPRPQPPANQSAVQSGSTVAATGLAASQLSIGR